jgi:hypothetical protein
MVKRMAARAVRLNCPKCLVAFSVVAYISKGVDRERFYKERAAQHDCVEHAKKLTNPGAGIKNPLKASKAAAKSR